MGSALVKAPATSETLSRVFLGTNYWAVALGKAKAKIGTLLGKVQYRARVILHYLNTYYAILKYYWVKFFRGKAQPSIIIILLLIVQILKSLLLLNKLRVASIWHFIAVGSNK